MKNILTVILCLVGGIAGGFLVNYFYVRDNLSEGVLTVEKQEIIIKENNAIIKAIKEVESSVVSIDGKASGIVVFADGLIVVPVDVFSENSKLYVEGKLTDYEIKKQDEDFVLIKIKGNGFPTLEFGEAEVGQSVFLVGSILNDENIITSVNQGIVKRIEPDFIITNIIEDPVLVGSSLFDVDGKMLGINVLDDSGFIKTIPASKIQEFLDL